eukprot:scaffold241_cov229-Prasinococcus_capsulatus_cf.AAC.16
MARPAFEQEGSLFAEKQPHELLPAAQPHRDDVLYATVYRSDSTKAHGHAQGVAVEQFMLVPGVIDKEGGVAWGRFEDAQNVTGWGVLDIESCGDYSADEQMFAAGVLEGRDRGACDRVIMRARGADRAAHLRGHRGRARVRSERQRAAERGGDGLHVGAAQLDVRALPRGGGRRLLGLQLRAHGAVRGCVRCAPPRALLSPARLTRAWRPAATLRARAGLLAGYNAAARAQGLEEQGVYDMWVMQAVGDLFQVGLRHSSSGVAGGPAPAPPLTAPALVCCRADRPGDGSRAPAALAPHGLRAGQGHRAPLPALLWPHQGRRGLLRRTCCRRPVRRCPC